MPRASIVIPWHRDLRDLRHAIGSVFRQTEQDLEIVVVANGVDDAAWQSVLGLSRDPRFRAERLAVASAPAARNRGLDMARGDLVFFLDADDVFFPDKLSTFLEAWTAQPFDVAFSRGVRERGNGVSWDFPIGFWDGGKPVSEFFFCDGGTISTSAIVISAAAKRLRFAEDCPSYQDPDLIMRAAAMGMRVVMLPDTLYRWSDDRIGGDRLSQKRNFAERLAWIDRLGDVATDRARAGFRARYVAQHDFPRGFARNLGFFRDALRLGAAKPREVALFMLRGLLPAGLSRRLVDFYFRRKARA